MKGADEAFEKSVCARLRDFLGDVRVDLSSLVQRGQSRTYRVEAAGRRWFVKWPDEMARMYPLLKAAADCPYLPKSLFDAPVPLDGGFLSCIEWAPSESVPPEKWTDAQLESFMSAYDSFFAAAQETPDVGAPEDDESSFAVIRDYATRHPRVAGLLKPLLDLKPEERTYRPGERLSVTHGDLHSRNYGFCGEQFAFFYDVDNVLWGYPADDLAYTVLDRAQRRSVSGARFDRCAEILRQFLAHFGRPVREWRVAINRKRLRQAASKIQRRPQSILPAIDIALRDRCAVKLMRAADLI